MRRRFTFGAALLAVGILTIVVILHVRSLHDTSHGTIVANGTPATDDQLAAFKALIRRQEKVEYNAWKTGDMRPLATVYYNDPDVKIDSGARQFLNDHPNGADKVKLLMTDGPIGAGDGYLSYFIAFESFGRGAKSRAQAVGGVSPPITILQASVSGSHAGVVYTVESPQLSSAEYHLTLSQVDGNWYISNQWYSGTP